MTQPCSCDIFLFLLLQPLYHFCTISTVLFSFLQPTLLLNWYCNLKSTSHPSTHLSIDPTNSFSAFSMYWVSIHPPTYLSSKYFLSIHHVLNTSESGSWKLAQSDCENFKLLETSAIESIYLFVYFNGKHLYLTLYSVFFKIISVYNFRSIFK